MPKLKYKPERDIPIAVRQMESLSPTKIVEWVLDRFNEERKPESVTNWFRRHPDVREALRIELIEGAEPEGAVDESIYEKGVFESLESIDKWAKDMRRRKVVNWKRHISSFKIICQGIKPKMSRNKIKIGERLDFKPIRVSYNVYLRLGYKKKDFKGIDLKEHGWVLKNPDRFNVETGLEYVDLMIEHYNDVDISLERNCMRNFLRSQGDDYERIEGTKHKSTGIYAKLYYPTETINQILEFVKSINYEAYVLDRFMYKTATRIEASLNARLENISEEGGLAEIQVFDKGNRKRYPKGHPWDKYLSEDLLEEIKLISGYPDRTTGNIFSITKEEIGAINWKALAKYVPELWEKFPQFDKVNHFWRHMFAQHMLRATDWRYGIVAELGGWTMKALEESYGKPSKELVREWGAKLMGVL